MFESAILTKGNTYKMFDYAVVVNAPIKLRKRRVMSRGGMSEELVKKIISQQSTEVEMHNKMCAAGINVKTIINDEKTPIKGIVKEYIDWMKEQI